MKKCLAIFFYSFNGEKTFDQLEMEARGSELEKMSEEQLDVLEEGIKETVDIKYYINSLYSPEQMKVILKGLVIARDMNVFAETIVSDYLYPNLTAEQMMEILNKKTELLNAQESRIKRILQYTKRAFIR